MVVEGILEMDSGGDLEENEKPCWRKVHNIQGLPGAVHEPSGPWGSGPLKHNLPYQMESDFGDSKWGGKLVILAFQPISNHRNPIPSDMVDFGFQVPDPDGPLGSWTALGGCCKMFFFQITVRSVIVDPYC